MNYVVLSILTTIAFLALCKDVPNEIVAPAAEAVFFESPGGSLVVGSYLIVGLKDDASSLADAKKVSEAYQTPLIAFVDELGWAQVSVSVDSLDELESLAKQIQKHSLVEFVMIDSKSPPPHVELAS